MCPFRLVFVRCLLLVITAFCASRAPAGPFGDWSSFDGEWHFIGTTLSGGAVRGYMDGGAPIVSSYGVGDGFGNRLPLVIGARAAGGTSFRGVVDEVRVSNVVRTDAWMNAEYRSQSGQMAVVGGTVAMTGLVAEYSHEAGNRLMDTSGQGRRQGGLGGS